MMTAERVEMRRDHVTDSYLLFLFATRHSLLTMRGALAINAS
jgi:hypothetical protein